MIAATVVPTVRVTKDMVLDPPRVNIQLAIYDHVEQVEPREYAGRSRADDRVREEDGDEDAVRCARAEDD